MIEVTNLTKHFYNPEQVTAVNEVSFQCGPGEVFGLLGPNGAGKTTSLRMIATLLKPDAGSITVAGHDVVDAPRSVRESIGFLSANTGLYKRLTAAEMIRYFAELQGVPDPVGRTQQLIARFGIEKFAHVRCDRLSTGMQQKVSIARAVVHSPPVMIFDEPTAGLDVLVSETLLSFIESCRDDGACVLFSTHIMREAERLCDRIGIIHAGRLLACGTLDELRAQTGEHHLEQVFIQLVEAEE